MVLRWAKKGGFEIFVQKNLFTLLVGVLVLVLLWAKAVDIGSAEAFDKRFFATDAGLTIDALYAVRPDVNVLFRASSPTEFGLRANEGSVTVYSDPTEGEGVQDTGKSFWFSGDRLFHFHDFELLPKREASRSVVVNLGLEVVELESPRGSSVFNLAKVGNDLGLARSDLNMLTPHCPAGSTDLRPTVNYNAINGIGSSPQQLTSGAVDVFGSLKKSQVERAIFYVNEFDQSANVACLLLQDLSKKFPSLDEVAIVPASPDLRPTDDPVGRISQEGVSMFVDLSLKDDSTDSKRKVADAIRGVFS